MPPSAPPRLSDLQLLLRDVFTDPSGARAASAARPQSLQWTVGSAAADAAARLSVYGDGYLLRMLEALAFDFKAVRRAAGENNFRRLCADYICAHPSTSPNLSDLGESFSSFIRNHSFSKRWRFLPDLASLERIVSTSLLTDRLPRVAPAQIASVAQDAWNDVRLALDPTLQLLDALWPVEKLWRAREESPTAPGRILRLPKRQKLLVYRDENWARVRELEVSEWALLSRLKQGAPLGEALSKTKATGDNVQRWISRWLSEGFIVGLRI